MRFETVEVNTEKPGKPRKNLEIAKLLKINPEKPGKTRKNLEIEKLLK